MKRRGFLKTALGAGAAAAVSGVSAGATAAVGGVSDVGISSNTGHEPYQRKQWVVAETTHCKIRGIDIAGIKQFRGVPYGHSTGGANRFLPPKDVTPWAGIRDAYGYGDICPQAFSHPEHPFGVLIDFDLHVGAMSEDCLNLNIWTPGVRDGSKRPVAVYFHGGGLNSGGGNYYLYVGERLARHADMVVVTVNHRLSVFGYLNLTDLGASAEFADSGNAGLLDLVKSLEWVRDNIENFGGDPGSVTIFGQSGGGSKVRSLMSMPRARGLFHRALSQSGSMQVQTREDSAASAKDLLKELNVGKGRIKDLQKIPFEQLVDAQLDIGSYSGITNPTVAVAHRPAFEAVIDGRTLSYSLTDPKGLANSASVPFIEGYCLHDAGWPMQNFDLDDAGLREVVKSLCGERDTQRVLDAYYCRYPGATPFLLQAAMLTDRKLLQNASRFAEARLTLGGADSYIYRFDWPSAAFEGKFGAVHGMDMSLIFFNDHQPTVGGDRPEARLMAAKTAGFFAAFARTGKPDDSLLPHWPAYTLARRDTMVINHPVSRAISDPNQPFRTLWAELAS